MDADLVSQLLVCMPFVAELTWLGFPSEVITYLSLPYKICFLKSQQPLALSFFPENWKRFIQFSSAQRHPICALCLFAHL